MTAKVLKHPKMNLTDLKKRFNDKTPYSLVLTSQGPRGGGSTFCTAVNHDRYAVDYEPSKFIYLM